MTSTGSSNAEIGHIGQSCFSVSDPVVFLVLFFDASEMYFISAKLFLLFCWLIQIKARL